MKIAKEDFLWYKKGQVVPDKDYQDNWEIFIEESKSQIEPKSKVLDINKDGKVDKKDIETVFSKVKKSLKGRPKKK